MAFTWNITDEQETLEALRKVAHGYKGIVHGDLARDGATFVDIEFPDAYSAASFADTHREALDWFPNIVAAIDIRAGDSITSLSQVVTLTVQVNTEWASQVRHLS